MREGFGQVLCGLLVNGMGMRVKQHKTDQFQQGLLMKVISHAAQSDLRRFRYRVSKSAGRDGRKTYSLTAKTAGFLNAVAVAAFKDLRLIFVAALPDRSNG